MSDQLLDTFIKLSMLDSPSGQEDSVADFLLHALERHADTQKDGFGNLYARIAGTGNPIFLAGHMDNVEPCRGVKPIVRNGVVSSSGNTVLGADNKAAIAAMVSLARRLSNKKRAHRTVEFVFTRSEESGNYGAMNFDYGLLEAKQGFCFDAVSPIGTIVLASPFYERFDITLLGKSAHASKPEKARNAITGFVDICNRIKQGRISKNTMANIGTLNAGTARNAIPGTLTLNGEIRSHNASEILEYRTGVASALKSMQSRMGVHHRAEFIRENSGYRIGWEDPAILHARRAMAAIGIAPKARETWAVSDANIFNEKGLRCVNLGDGVMNPHTTMESIRVSDLRRMLMLMHALATTAP